MMLDAQTLNSFQNIGMTPDQSIECIPYAYGHRTLVPRAG